MPLDRRPSSAAATNEPAARSDAQRDRLLLWPRRRVHLRPSSSGRRAVKFGVFYELSVPRPWTQEAERQVYLNALEQVRLADELGFHSVWCVEHHFLEEYSHSSAPELFLTACAMQTQNIRVGHGIVVCVPQFKHPIRVAERAARRRGCRGRRPARRRGPSSAASRLIRMSPRRRGT